MNLFLSRAAVEENAYNRMKQVVKWYLSGFYKKPKVRELITVLELKHTLCALGSTRTLFWLLLKMKDDIS